MLTTKPILSFRKLATGAALLAATAGLGGCYYGPAYGPRYAYAAPVYAAPAYGYGPGYYAAAPAYGYGPYGGSLSLSFGEGRRRW
jgi:hypothetical protein